MVELKVVHERVKLLEVLVVVVDKVKIVAKSMDIHFLACSLGF